MDIIIQFIESISLNHCIQSEFIDFTGITNKSILKVLDRIKLELSDTIPVFENNQYKNFIINYRQQMMNFKLIKKSKLDTQTPIIKSRRSSTPGVKTKFQHVEYFTTFYNGSSINWETIKNMTRDNVQSLFDSFINKYSLTRQDAIDWIQILFWFFRKGIVDSMLKIYLVQDDCKKFASGSVKLTSDYDITIDGLCAANISKNFTQSIFEEFGISSGQVFDTNIYYSSFITFLPTTNMSKFYTQYTNCKGDNGHNKSIIYVTRENQETSSYQHVWAALKLTSQMMYLESSTSSTFKPEKYTRGIDNGLSKYYQLKNILLELKESNISGQDVIESVQRLLGNPLSQLNLVDYTNQLSFTNFKNPETYYTRGAFLHIVLNEQMCKIDESNQDRSFGLSIHAYIDSFIENVGDFIHYYYQSPINKLKTEKYKKRFLFAIKQVSKKLYNIVQCLLTNNDIDGLVFTSIELIFRYIDDAVLDSNKDLLSNLFSNKFTTIPANPYGSMIFSDINLNKGNSIPKSIFSNLDISQNLSSSVSRSSLANQEPMSRRISLNSSNREPLRRGSLNRESVRRGSINRVSYNSLNNSISGSMSSNNGFLNNSVNGRMTLNSLNNSRSNSSIFSNNDVLNTSLNGDVIYPIVEDNLVESASSMEPKKKSKVSKITKKISKIFK